MLKSLSLSFFRENHILNFMKLTISHLDTGFFFILGGFPRKEHGRNPQRRMPASETATSGTPLDPSMSLRVAPQNNSSNQVINIECLKFSKLITELRNKRKKKV